MPTGKGRFLIICFDPEKCMFIPTKNLQNYDITNKGQFKVEALPQELQVG
jgi:hypothetical protein